MQRGYPFVEEIVWDGWNLRHIAEHDVVAAQVEHVLLGKPVFAGSYKDRLPSGRTPASASWQW